MLPAAPHQSVEDATGRDALFRTMGGPDTLEPHWMSAVLQSALAYPTALLTALLGVVLVYWISVIVGALGIDVLDGDVQVDLGGALGGADGALEASPEGAADGAADGALEAGEGTTGLAAALAILKIGQVPLTIVISLLVFWAWTFAMVASGLFGHGLGWLAGSGLLAGSLVGSFFASALSVRPLAPLFVAHEAPTRRSLIGRICEITSGAVDARYGQASVADGGAGLIVSVVCERANGLKKGDQALLIEFDPSRDQYLVEPVDELLPEELRGRVEATDDGVVPARPSRSQAR